jgi:hypothetical protein
MSSRSPDQLGGAGTGPGVPQLPPAFPRSFVREPDLRASQSTGEKLFLKWITCTRLTHGYLPRNAPKAALNFIGWSSGVA